MLYLLDTTTFSALIYRDANTLSRITALDSVDRVVICPITRGEILYGLTRLSSGKRKSELEAQARYLFAQIPCLSIPETAADRYAEIKREAELKGTPLDENDLWIAALALSMRATLVTKDSDFDKVGGLNVKDWAQ